MNSAPTDKKINIFIHAGYGKTATTFLQKSILSKLEDVLYLGKDPHLSPEIKAAHDKLFSPLYQRNDFTVRARNSCLLIAEYGDLIVAEICRQPDIDKIVISDENIFDYSNYNAELNIYLVGRLFRYLKKAINGQVETTVLITIRNQPSILQSFFAADFYLLKNRFKDVDAFVDYGYKNSHYANFGGYFYDEVISELQEQFGAEFVKVFLFEHLREDPALFIRQLVDFIGSKADIKILDTGTYVNRNSGDGGNYILYLNLAGRILGWGARFLSRNAHRMGISVERLERLKKIFRTIRKKVVRTKSIGVVQLDAGHLARIRLMYDDSNRRLSELMGLDLRQYGYFYSQDSDSSS